MKQTFKWIALLALITIVFSATNALATEKTKKFHESWAASGIETVNIVNKFGEVKITNKGGNEITIDVLVTVEASSENKAIDLLDKISVSMQKNGKTVYAKTTIENNFSSQRRFSIDYVVNVPSDKNLEISNKYGNTIVNQLFANGQFDIQYGNLTANELKAPGTDNMNVRLAYGKASIETANDLRLDLQYSGITVGKMKDLLLQSKYSSLDLEEGGNIRIDSKYDKYNFGKVASVLATTKYTQVRIEKLAKSLKIEAGYGGIRVNEISADFESVSVTNAYGQISLGLGKASYSVDASCEYCGISYPENNFKGNKIKERNTQTIEGKVGNGGRTIYIRSRYGEIRLDD